MTEASDDFFGLKPFQLMTEELQPCLAEISEILSSAGKSWPDWVVRGMEADLLRGYHLAGEVENYLMPQQGQDSDPAMAARHHEVAARTRVELAAQLAIFLASAKRHIGHARRLEHRFRLVPQLGIWAAFTLLVVSLIVQGILGHGG